MKTPSDDDLYLAAQWLEIYEGEEGSEAEAVHGVAKWLLARIAANEFRASCKDAGVPVARARQILRAKGEQP